MVVRSSLSFTRSLLLVALATLAAIIAVAGAASAATFTLTSLASGTGTNDCTDGTCLFEEAMAAVTTDADIVVIDLGAGSITLTGNVAPTNTVTIQRSVAGTITIQPTAAETFTIADGKTLIFDVADGGTIDMDVQITDGAGTGAVTKNGAGQVTFSSNTANDYAGATTISAGTLHLEDNGADNGALGSDAGDTSITSGATLSMNAASIPAGEAISVAGTGDDGIGAIRATSNSASIAGPVTLTGASTFTANGVTLTFSGIIDGAFAVTTGTASNTGTVAFSGANTYSGGTTAAFGTLSGTTTSLQGAITNNAVVLFNQNTDGEYAGNMDGTGLLSKAGTGVLTLSGTNTNSGGTTITDGEISISSGNNLGSGTITLDSGQLTIASTTTLGETINVNSASALFVAAGELLEHNGILSGAAALEKLGDGSLTLNGGSNTYSGILTITLGTVRVSPSSTTFFPADIVNNAALEFTSWIGAATYSGDISGTGTVTKNGDDPLVLTGDNTYSGTTTVTNGNLEFAPSGTNLPTGNLVSSTTTIFDIANGDAAFGGVISGAGAVTKEGADVLTLSGANTYTGETTVSVGTLAVTHASALGSAVDATDDTTVASGASLRIDNVDIGAEQLILSGTGAAGGALYGTGTAVADGAITLAAATTVAAANAASLDLTGVITSAGFDLTYGSTGNDGVVILRGDNDPSFADAMIVAFGTLRLMDDSALGTFGAGEGTTVNHGAILELEDTDHSEPLTLAGTIDASGVSPSWNGAITLNDASSTFTGDATEFVLFASATITDGGNGYTLNVEVPTTFGAAVTIGTLVLNEAGADFTIPSGSDLGTLTVTNAATVTVTDANALILGASGTITTLTVTLAGVGDLTDSGAITVTGTTQITAGTNNVELNNANLLGTVDIVSAAAVTLVDTAGTLSLQGSMSSLTVTTTDGAVDDSAGLIVSGLSTFTLGTGTLTFDHASTDLGSVTIVSAGATTLNDATGITLNAITTSGAFTVDTASGSITLLGAINTDGAVTFHEPVILGASITINTVDDAINLLNAISADAPGRALTVGADSAAVTFPSVVASSGTPLGALTSTGTGNNVFNGNVFADSIAVTGTSQIVAQSIFTTTGGQTWTGAVTQDADTDAFYVDTSANDIDFAGSFSRGVGSDTSITTGALGSAIAGTIDGDGTLTKLGAGTLTLTDGSTYTGATLIEAGVLSIGASSGVGVGGGVTIGGAATDGTLRFTASEANFAHAITVGAAGGIIDVLDGFTVTVPTAFAASAGPLQTTSSDGANTGILVLSGSNTLFTGSINVASGELHVGEANALGATSAGTTVANGATLLVVNGITTAAEPLTLEGGSTLANTGTSTYSGPITLTGSATIGGTGTAFTLAGAIDEDDATPSLTLTVNGPTTTTFGSTVGSTNALSGLTLNTGVAADANQVRANTLLIDAAGDSFSFTNAANDFTSASAAAAAGVTLVDVDDITLGAITITGALDVTADLISISAAHTGSSLNYRGPVELAADVTLTGTTQFGIVFHDTLDSDTTARQLTTTLSHAFGVVAFHGDIGVTEPLASLTVNGFAELHDDVRTTGAQTWNKNVIMLAVGPDTAEITSTAGTITFNRDLDGDAGTLLVIDGAAVTLGGDVGCGMYSVGSVQGDIVTSIDVHGPTTLDYWDAGFAQFFCLSDGHVTFHDAVDLAWADGLAIDVESLAGDVTFMGAVTTSAASYIEIYPTGGNVDFQSTIGSETDPLTGLYSLGATTTNFGGHIWSDEVEVQAVDNNGDTALEGPGTTTINGNVISSGNQIYDGPVIVANDVTLEGVVISFGDTVDSEATEANDLTLIGGASLISFDGAVGSAVDGALGALTRAEADTGATTFGGTVDAASVDIGSIGLTTLTGAVTTTGAQNFDGGLLLAAHTTLAGTSIVVAFDAGTVDLFGFTLTIINTDALTNSMIAGVIEDTSGGAHAASLVKSGAGRLVLTDANTFTGTVSVVQGTLAVDHANALGATTPDAGTTIDDGATLELVSVSTAAEPLDLAGTLMVTDADSTFGGPITLTDDASLGTGGGAFVLTLGGTVDSDAATPYSLTASTLSRVVFDAAVGSVEPLWSVSSSVPVTISTTEVTTLTMQSYSAAVTLADNAHLTLLGDPLSTSGIFFDQAILSPTTAYSLYVTTATHVDFTSTVGSAIEPLLSLTVDGTGTVYIENNIYTSGEQLYELPVRVSGAATLTSTTSWIEFDSTVDSFGTARALTIDAADDVYFYGDVGSSSALLSLEVTDDAFIDGDVTTTTFQTYNGFVESWRDMTFTGTVITFESWLDSEEAVADEFHANVIIDATSVYFLGDVGSWDPLKTLDVTGATFIGASTIITDGVQWYHDTVELDADTALVTSNAAVTFDDAITSNTGEDLTVAAGTALVTFASTIGTDTQPIGALARTGTGDTDFGDLVYAASVSISGATVLTQDVTTTFGQTYTGPVVLAASSTLTGTTITMPSTVDLNTFTLTIVNSDASSIGGAISEGAASSLVKDGDGVLTLSGPNTYTGLTTINEGTLRIAHALGLGAGDASSVVPSATRTIVNAGAVLDVETVDVSNEHLDLNGGTLLGTGTNPQWTGTTASFAPIRLLATSTIESQAAGEALGTGFRITRTIANTGAAGLTLTVADAGDLLDLNGVVGGSTPVAWIDAWGDSDCATDGVVRISSTGGVTTSGPQWWELPFQFSATTSIVSTGDDVDFLCTVIPVGGFRTFTVSANAPGGAVSFADAVGTPGTLSGSLSNLVVNANEAIMIGGEVDTTGAQTYNGPVVVTGHSDLASTGGTITFQSTLDAEDADENLDVSAASVVLNGAVGSMTPLESLEVVGPATLDGGSLIVDDLLAFYSAVSVTDHTTFESSLGGVAFISTLDDDFGGYSVMVTSATGTLFQGAVSVGSLNVASGITEIDASVETDGDQSYADSVAVITGSVACDDASPYLIVGGALSMPELAITDAHLTITVGEESEITGVISGGCGFTKEGEGTLTLSAINTYTGITDLNEGMLVITSDSGLGAADVAFPTYVGAGTTLQIADADSAEPIVLEGATLYGTGTSPSLAGAITLAGDSFIVSDATDFALSGNIGDGIETYGLSTSGAGQTTLSGANTFNGDVYVDEGTLVAASNGALGDGGDVIVADGATLLVSAGAVLTTHLLALAGTLGATNGGGTWTGAITLTDNAVIGGNAVLTINGKIDSDTTIILDGDGLPIDEISNEWSISGTNTGLTRFARSVGDDWALGSVTMNGPVDFGVELLEGQATVTTTVSQVYIGDVVLWDTVLVSGGPVAFWGTVNNNGAFPSDLTVIAATSDITFLDGIGEFGDLGALDLEATSGDVVLRYNVHAASLAVTGNSVRLGMNPDAVQVVTSGAQEYDGPVVVVGQMTLEASTIDFLSTVDDDGDGESLDITTTGGVTFAAPVGGSVPLGYLAVDDGPATLPASVSTDFEQEYWGDVTLVQHTTLTSPDYIGLLGAVDADALGAWDLTATSDWIDSYSSVGANFPLGNIVLDATEVELRAAITAGSLDVTGMSTLGDDITTTGFQSYGGAVWLDAAAPLALTTDSWMEFASTIDGAEDLTITVGTDEGEYLDLYGDVGWTLFAQLNSFTVNGETYLNGVDIQVLNDLTFNGDLGIGGPIATQNSLRSATGGATIRVTGVVESDDGSHLSVDGDGGGLVIFEQDVGSVGFPIGDFEAVQSSDSIEFWGNVWAGSIDIAGYSYLSGDVHTTGTQIYGDYVEILEDITMTASAIEFFDWVDSEAGVDPVERANLVISTTDGTTFYEAVGSNDPLMTLWVMDGETVLWSDVTTDSWQEYQDVLLDGMLLLVLNHDPITLTGSSLVMEALGLGTHDIVLVATDSDENSHIFGVVSGTGSLTFDGEEDLLADDEDADLHLHGVNTYTGGTTVESGVLLGQVAGSITGDIAIWAPGEVEFSADTDEVYTGVMSGDGELQKFGTNNVRITQLQTFTGDTVVGEGLLEIVVGLDPMSLVEVQDGGILGGAGSVGSARVLAGGALLPGGVDEAAPEQLDGVADLTMTVNDLVMDVGSFLLIRGDPDNDVDEGEGVAVTTSLDVTTSADIDGASIVSISETLPAGLHTVLTAGDLLGGQFAEGALLVSGPNAFNVAYLDDVTDSVTLTALGAVPTAAVNNAPAVTEPSSGTTTATFTITLVGAHTFPVTVWYETSDVSAVAPGDYTAVSGFVTFAAGELTKTVPVTIHSGSEATETFSFLLTHADGANIIDDLGIGTISQRPVSTGGTGGSSTPPVFVAPEPEPEDDTTPKTSSSGTATESTPGTFTVTLSDSGSGVTAEFNDKTTGVETISASGTGSAPVTVTVSALPEIPADIPTPAGQLLSAFQADITAADGTKATIQSAVITFTVPLASLGGAPVSELMLQHYDAATGEWETLPTTCTAAGAVVVCSATTTSFSPFAVSLDKLAPSVTLAVAGDLISGTFADIGRGVDVTSLVVSLNGEALFTTVSGGAFTAPLPAGLAAGLYDLAATVRDLAGNTATATATATITAPEVPVSEPDTPDTTTPETPEVPDTTTETPPTETTPDNTGEVPGAVIEDDKGTPGFGLAALVAALGVALVVMRRRQ